MTKLTNPRPLFLNARGNLLDDGSVYIGQANADPEANPVQVFFDPALTVPAAQPLRTLGGVIVNGAAPAFIFFAADDVSYRVRDADGGQVDYVPSLFSVDSSYQPLDDDLTAIAALGTTAYGRGLLTLANQAALRTAIGYPEPLPAAGGAVSGNITRSGAGTHVYWANQSMTSGRRFLTAADAADPTSAPGDEWLKYA